MSKIRVLLVKEQGMFREGDRARIRYYDNIEGVGEE